mgnify:CR=1 FL=1
MRALLDDSVERGGFAAISTFHFGNPDFTNSEPFLHRWRGQIPFIGLQDAHGNEPWWFADQTTGYRTLFLAEAPTWDGWLKALKENWVVAVRHDEMSRGETWMHSGSDEVRDFVQARENEWRWWSGEQGKSYRPMASLVALRPEDEFEVGRPAQGVATFEQAHHGLGVELAAAVDVAVFARHHVGQFLAFDGNAQAFANAFEHACAALFMTQVTRQQVWRRGAFAQVVKQAGQAYRQRGLQAGAHVEDHHQMDAGVDFGVVFSALRYAPELVYFGQQARQRPALTQQREHARGCVFHQAPGEFLPDPFGHQMVRFTGLHHVLHQVHGFRCHREIGKTRRQPRHPHLLAPGQRDRETQQQGKEERGHGSGPSAWR